MAMICSKAFIVLLIVMLTTKPSGSHLMPGREIHEDGHRLMINQRLEVWRRLHEKLARECRIQLKYIREQIMVIHLKYFSSSLVP